MYSYAQTDTTTIRKALPEITIYPSQLMYDTLSVFRYHWDNENIFPYSFNKSKIEASDTIVLEIVDSANHYAFPFYGRINSGFGKRRRIFHKGLDIHLEKGDIVKAAFDGKVRYAKFNKGGYGNLIIIRHVNEIETYYAHLTTIDVKPNQIVKAGDFIGTGGNTGARWTGEHLHFEMRYFDSPFDPQLVFNFDSVKLNANYIELTKESFKIKKTSRGAPLKEKSDSSDNKLSTVKHYTIKKGDTLSKIARNQHTTVRKLCKINGFTKNTKLLLGKVIRIS